MQWIRTIVQQNVPNKANSMNTTQLISNKSKIDGIDDLLEKRGEELVDLKAQVAETTVLFKELMKKHVEMEDQHAFTLAMKAQLDHLLNGPLKFSLADIGNMAGFIENKMQNIAIALPRIDKPYRDFLAEEVKHNEDGGLNQTAYRVRMQSLAGYTPHHRVPTFVSAGGRATIFLFYLLPFLSPPLASLPSPSFPTSLSSPPLPSWTVVVCLPSSPHRD